MSSQSILESLIEALFKNLLIFSVSTLLLTFSVFYSVIYMLFLIKSNFSMRLRPKRFVFYFFLFIFSFIKFLNITCYYLLLLLLLCLLIFMFFLFIIILMIIVSWLDSGFNDVFVYCVFSGLATELCVLEDFLCKHFVISFCS